MRSIIKTPDSRKIHLKRKFQSSIKKKSIVLNPKLIFFIKIKTDHVIQHKKKTFRK